MMKRFLVLSVVIALLVCVTSAAMAAWEPTKMGVFGMPDLTLTITPSWSFDSLSGDYTYTYVLTNDTPSDYVEGFTLGFEDSIPVTSLTPSTTPTGWIAVVRSQTNKINWGVIPSEDAAIAPGESKTFAFTTKYGPGSELSVYASSQNFYGFSGMTYGPVVPEPSSMLAMFSGLVGLAGMRLRRK